MKFQRRAGRILFADPRLRSTDAVHANRRGQADLWKYGISGDLPIVLVDINHDGELALFNDLLKAHEYLRGKGLLFDLVVLNAQGASYRLDLQNTIQAMVENGPEQAWIDRPGGVFLRRSDLMPPEDQLLLRAAARAVERDDAAAASSGRRCPSHARQAPATSESMPRQYRRRRRNRGPGCSAASAASRTMDANA